MAGLSKKGQPKYIVGYTGYTPGHISDNYIGAPFTETSHAALWNFQSKQNKPETAKKVVDPAYSSPKDFCESKRPVTKYTTTNYTGHVPAYKFKHGGSFGKLTDLKVF